MVARTLVLLRAPRRTRGSTYRMVKFRTMVPDAEKLTGAVWAKHPDPRRHKLWQLAASEPSRRTTPSLEHSAGEMGLIGPRPTSGVCGAVGGADSVLPQPPCR